MPAPAWSLAAFWHPEAGGRSGRPPACENAVNTDPALRRCIYLIGRAFSAAHGVAHRAKKDPGPIAD